MGDRREVFPDKAARDPGDVAAEFYWDEEKQTVTIKYNAAFWGPSGQSVVLVDGIPMPRRKADTLRLASLLQRIADRKHEGKRLHPVDFT